MSSSISDLMALSPSVLSEALLDKTNTKTLNEALLKCAWAGSSAGIRLCAVLGVNLDAKNNDGWTAAMHAAVNGHSEVLAVLADRGANLDAKNNFGGTAAMSAALNGHSEALTVLADRGAKLDAKDNNGETAAMYAAKIGHIEVLAVLADRGSNLDARDNNGWTAAMHAAANDQGEAEIFLKRRSGTPVTVALSDLRSLFGDHAPVIRKSMPVI